MLHPDHNTAPDAVEKFQALNEAYQILGTPHKRAAYAAESGAVLRATGRTVFTTGPYRFEKDLDTPPPTGFLTCASWTPPETPPF
ncbi:MAG: hypothetical protein FD149_2568 [Rhodospirillaceae bacterium]|nr:MAG: hypothetical protein FD149_2568 [Rhodospirillaceae bacterium]